MKVNPEEIFEFENLLKDRQFQMLFNQLMDDNSWMFFPSMSSLETSSAAVFAKGLKEEGLLFHLATIFDGETDNPFLDVTEFMDIRVELVPNGVKELPKYIDPHSKELEKDNDVITSMLFLANTNLEIDFYDQVVDLQSENRDEFLECDDIVKTIKAEKNKLVVFKNNTMRRFRPDENEYTPILVMTYLKEPEIKLQEEPEEEPEEIQHGHETNPDRIETQGEIGVSV